jgi:hypothetical protein
MCRQTGATTKRGVLRINAVQKQGSVEPTNAQMCPARTSPTQQGRLVHPIQTILSQHFEGERVKRNKEKLIEKRPINLHRQDIWARYLGFAGGMGGCVI